MGLKINKNWHPKHKMPNYIPDYMTTVTYKGIANKLPSENESKKGDCILVYDDKNYCVPYIFDGKNWNAISHQEYNMSIESNYESDYDYVDRIDKFGNNIYKELIGNSYKVFIDKKLHENFLEEINNYKYWIK